MKTFAEELLEGFSHLLNEETATTIQSMAGHHYARAKFFTVVTDKGITHSFQQSAENVKKVVERHGYTVVEVSEL